MGEATVRELRNEGGRILERVLSGERVTVTRDGKPVARLEPIGRQRLTAEVLVERFARLPDVDWLQLREDIDAVIDPRI